MLDVFLKCQGELMMRLGAGSTWTDMVGGVDSLRTVVNVVETEA